MSVTIESEFKEFLAKFEQKLDKFAQKLDNIQKDITEIKQNDLVELKLGKAEIKGDVKALDEKIGGVSKRLNNQEFLNRTIVASVILSLTCWRNQTIFSKLF